MNNKIHVFKEKVKVMIEVDRESINFNNIEIDEYWNLGNITENKMHKIHTYPAKFPAFITQKALEYASKERLIVRKIADIFCGCGTVAYEATKEKIDFWGCDINPVAALIARVKSKKLDPQKLDGFYKSITAQFYQNSNCFLINEINPRIRYWFDDVQIFDLSLLRACIIESTHHNKDYEDFFNCAFSNILKPTSKWLTKSIKPQKDLDKVPADVLSSFQAQFKFMLKANHESEACNNCKVEIEIGSSLEIDKTNSFDLIVTSPPYVTSYEYADLHQLSLLWLGYADDYRDFRKDTIGSSYSYEGRLSNNLNKWEKRL